MLDLLSDIGGLQGILTAIAISLLSVFNYNHFENYLVSRLYKLAKSDSHDWIKYRRHSDRATHLPVNKVRNARDWCIERVLPSKLVCCKMNRRERAM